MLAKSLPLLALGLILSGHAAGQQPAPIPASRAVFRSPRYGIDSLSVDSAGNAFFLGANSVRRGFWQARLPRGTAQAFLAWVVQTDCPNNPIPPDPPDGTEPLPFAPCGLLLCDYDCGYARYEQSGRWHTWYVNPDSLPAQLIDRIRGVLARPEWTSLGH